MVDQLLEVEEFPNHILEPCCGEARAISSRLSDYDFKVTEYDLFAGPEQSRRDFLVETRTFPAIITNPPFKLAREFVETALRVADKFAFLLPLDYLHGQRRYKDFYSKGLGPNTVYIFTRRPDLSAEFRTDGKYKTGAVTFAWFVWDKAASHGTHVNWIDNSEYVLRVAA